MWDGWADGAMEGLRTIWRTDQRGDISVNMPQSHVSSWYCSYCMATCCIFKWQASFGEHMFPGCLYHFKGRWEKWQFVGQYITIAMVAMFFHLILVVQYWKACNWIYQDFLNQSRKSYLQKAIWFEVSNSSFIILFFVGASSHFSCAYFEIDPHRSLKQFHKYMMFLLVPILRYICWP